MTRIGNVADGWKLVPLGRTAEITMGNSPPGNSYNDVCDGVPLVNGPVEFSEGALGLTIKSKYTTSPTKMCKRGDLLICVRGSTTGRTNIAAFDACIGRGVAAVRTREHQPYINHFICSRRRQIFRSGSGSTFPSVTRDQLADLQVPVPPLAEQKRIAAILDQADAIRRRRRQAIETTAGLIPAIFHEMFGDPAENPKRWRTLPFADLLSGGMRNGESPARNGSVHGIVLTLSAITGTEFDATASKEAEFGHFRKVSRVSIRDFLICRGNGNRDLVGVGKQPDANMPGVVFPDTMIAARVDSSKLSMAFLDSQWRTQHVRRQIVQGARTTNGTYKINQKLLGGIELVVPPVDTQEAFSARASVVRGLLDKQRHAMNESNANFDSLVQRAFRGAL